MKQTIRTQCHLIDKSEKYITILVKFQKVKDADEDFGNISNFGELARAWACAVGAGMKSPVQLFKAGLKVFAIRLVKLEKYELAARWAGKFSVASFNAPIVISQLKSDMQDADYADLTYFVLFECIGYVCDTPAKVNLEANDDEDTSQLEERKKESQLDIWSGRV